MSKYILKFNENENYNEELLRRINLCAENKIDNVYECLEDFENNYSEFIDYMTFDMNLLISLMTKAYRSNNLEFIRFFIEHKYVVLPIGDTQNNNITKQLFLNMCEYYIYNFLYDDLLKLLKIVGSIYDLTDIFNDMYYWKIIPEFYRSLLDIRSDSKVDEFLRLFQYFIDINGEVVYNYNVTFVNNIQTRDKLRVLYLYLKRENVVKSNKDVDKFYSTLINEFLETFTINKYSDNKNYINIMDDDLTNMLHKIISDNNIDKDNLFKYFNSRMIYVKILYYVVNINFERFIYYYFSKNDGDLSYIDSHILKEAIALCDEYVTEKDVVRNEDDEDGFIDPFSYDNTMEYIISDMEFIFEIFNSTTISDELYSELFKRIMLNKDVFYMYITQFEKFYKNNSRIMLEFKKYYHIDNIDDLKIISNMLL